MGCTISTNKHSFYSHVSNWCNCIRSICGQNFVVRINPAGKFSAINSCCDQLSATCSNFNDSIGLDRFSSNGHSTITTIKYEGYIRSLGSSNISEIA